MFFGPPHTLSPQPANFVTMTTTNQTTPKKNKRSRTSCSQGAREATPRHPGRRQRRQLSRKHHRRAQTRRRSGHGQIRPRQTVTVVGEEEDGPSSYIPMAFLLAADVIRRADKDLWWRVTPDSCGKGDICVGSRQKWEDVLPAFIEADLLRSKSVGGGKYVSYSTTRKNGRTCSNISRSIIVV